MPTLTGVPVTNQQIVNFRKQFVATDGIEFSAGNTRNVRLPTEQCIQGIECMMSFDWESDDAGELTAAKALNLIKWLRLKTGGTSDIISLQGKVLPYIHQIYFRESPYASQPGVNGSGSARIHFYIPNNAALAEHGGAAMMSPLDVSRTTANLEIQWGDASDIWSAGTNSISNVKFEVDVEQSFSVDKGIPGATGYGGYLLHLMTTDEIPVTATRESLPFDLTQEHVFSRVIVYTETDGEFADGILNSVSIKAGEATHQKLTATKLQVRNKSRYKFTQLQTGVYVVDLMTPGHWEQMLSFESDQRFRLDFNVTKPAEGDSHRMYVVYDRFLRP